jgi:serine/threonine-protein kinase
MEAEVESDLTTTGDVLGTPAYIAPERAEGKAATAVSDLWSLGVVLYEALANRRPFSGDSAFAAALAARQGSITPLSSLRPDLSPRVVQVVERALSPNPADRFASAAAMATALGVGLAGAGPNRRLADHELMAVGETGQPTATQPLPPEDVAIPPYTQRLDADPGARARNEGKAGAGAHRRKRRSRAGRWAWLAAGAAALVTFLALAASGALSSSAHGTTGNSHPAQSRVPPTTVTTAAAPPSTVAPSTTAPPPTTAPPTTAPPPSQPATTAPPETSPPSDGAGNPHGGDQGGQGDQGAGHGHSGGQGH